MALVYNYNDDIAAAAFIVGLQINHSYKQLVKHNITNMKDMSQAQKYIQLKAATRSSTSQPPKQESEGEKTK